MLIRELTRLYGSKRVWITEYGYQTNPPDRTFGVSFVKQARWLTQSFAIARAHRRIELAIRLYLNLKREGDPERVEQVAMPRANQ